MNHDKDCSNCKHHQQGTHPAHIPGCFDCLNSLALPGFEPKEEFPLETQVGGSHYKGFTIQPIEFAMVNGLNACQAKVVKYVCRKKGDLQKQLEDLDKAVHVIQLYKALLQAGKVA